MGFGFLIAVLFSLGDLYVALGSKTGFPIIEVVYGATESKLATSLMISGIIFSAITSTWANLAAASRTTWAFSRDNGLPYSSYFAHVMTSIHFSITQIRLLILEFRSMSPALFQSEHLS